MRRAFPLFGLLFAVSALHATELDKYLVEPLEQPSRCAKIKDLLPVNDKVAAFYEGKYASVVPPPVDRHAQSFDCESSSGTLYFFQYKTVNDADQALLFAKPVVTKGTGSPMILDWSGGFVILSFAQMPDDLRKVVEKKLTPPSLILATIPEPVFTAPVSTFTIPTAPSVTASSVTVSSVTVSSVTVSSVTVSSVTVSSVTVSSVTVPTAVKTYNLESPPDLSPATMKRLKKIISCGDWNLPAELKEACRWFSAFQSGKAMSPVILSTGARIGQGYRIHDDGSISGAFFQAAVGSGKVGEISLIPLFVGNGVEEMELRSKATAKEGQATPKLSQVFQSRIDDTERPGGRTFIRTLGESWLARRPDQTLYLRGWGSRWVILSIPKSQDGESDFDRFSLSVFQ